MTVKFFVDIQMFRFFAEFDSIFKRSHWTKENLNADGLNEYKRSFNFLFTRLDEVDEKIN